MRIDRRTATLPAFLAWLLATPALAQAPAPLAVPPGQSPGAPAGARAQDAPVTFSADEVEYDQNRSLVTARGRVEAWQGDRILRADEFTYNRETGVATARGNVQLLEPDGQVLFAEEAELSGNMRDGVLTGLRGLLAGNARVAAAGARRTGGTLFDLARVVYSACAPCEDDPLAPPLWQLRARVATLDQEARQVRYRDAAVEFGGVPLFWTPYLQHPDGTAPRQSGFLAPELGITRYLGAFAQTPYYWAIDEQSDLTVSPTISSEQVPNLAGEYRRRFNSGEIQMSGSAGYLSDRGNDTDTGFGGHFFSRGRFSIDENWRAGGGLNVASSEYYLRAWRIGTQRLLTSDLFTEGFWGTDAYARFDLRGYQGLRPSDDSAVWPYVLPRLYYEHAFRPDALGGQFSIDAAPFSIYRQQGTNTQRLASRLRYELPMVDGIGSVWTVRAQSDLMAWWATNLNEAPNYAPVDSNSVGRANIRGALDWRLPLVRSAGEWGSQIIEPRVQFVTGPQVWNQTDIPNEDSIDFEFTDANLFALNRYTGRDRQEGGSRVDYALRAAWLFPNGGQAEAFGGRSYRFTEASDFSQYSGLAEQTSNWVARVRLAPVPWFEVLGRARFGDDFANQGLTEWVARLSLGDVALTGGYIYSAPNPEFSPPAPREEVQAGFTARLGQYWRVGGFARYDLEFGRPVLYAASAAYEDECFILEGRFSKYYAVDTANNNALYPSSTLVLIRIGLKTIGDFSFRAI